MPDQESEPRYQICMIRLSQCDGQGVIIKNSIIPSFHSLQISISPPNLIYSVVSSFEIASSPFMISYHH